MTRDEHDTKYHREAWMTDDQWRCCRLLADLVGGFHHVMGTFRECGKGVRITIPAYRLSTFDSNGLTTLVLLAHDRAVRVDISGGVAHRVTLTLHPRSHTETNTYARHPTIEQAIALHRRYEPAPAVPLPPTGEGEA